MWLTKQSSASLTTTSSKSYGNGPQEDTPQERPVDPEEILLLSSSTRQQGWQLVSGALEAGETLLDGTLREVYEELGPDLQIQPVGTVHMGSFHYDALVQYMLESYYLFSFQNGKIVPSDDMVGSAFRWWSLAELEDQDLHFHPSVQPWMLKRAVALYRMWAHETDLPLQLPLK